MKVNYVDGIVLLDVHDLPADSAKWERLTPYLLLPTQMRMTIDIYRALTMGNYSTWCPLHQTVNYTPYCTGLKKLNK